MNAKSRESRKARRGVLIGAAGLIVLMLALAAAWRWTSLQDVVDPALISAWLNDAADEGWMPLLVAGVYVGGSLVMFPNTVLCLTVILALGPLLGTAYAYGGSMVAALVGYSMGRWGGRRIEKLRVPAVDRISKELRRGGFVQMVALRVLPLAPFSATNILSGAARVRLLSFAAATAVGISPYILTFAVFGRQARRMMANPTLADAAIMLGIAAVAAGALWWTRSRLKNA